MIERKSGETLGASAIRDLAEAPSLVILLDLDGTLLPIAPTPPMKVDAVANELLHDLTRLPGVQLVVLSGRTRSSLATLFPTQDLWLVAEHGAWRRGKDGSFRSTIEGNPTVLRRCGEVLEHIAARYRGAWAEPKSWSVCFHYRMVDPLLQPDLLAELDNAILSCLVSAPEYERLNGAATVEVRHRGAHKGTVIDWVHEEIGGGSKLLILGDDLTDEDAFRVASPDDATIHVGGGDTCARFTLADSEAVRAFLRTLIDERSATPSRSMSLPPPAELSTEPGLVVVSNRMPPAASPAGRKGNVGGLVSALRPALEARGGGIWVGWSGRAKKGVPFEGASLQLDPTQEPARAALDLSPEALDQYYDGFCNRTLWPLLHGFFSKVRYDDDEWRAYVAVNRAFADAVTRVAPPHVPVWVHDYHLMLVASELRARGHTGPIGFFLHVPLPSVELVETLPWSHELLQAMLDYDLVGFHTERYVTNYVAAQVALNGAEATPEGVRKEARSSRVGAFPIGIAPDGFGAPREPEEADEISNLIRTLGDRRLILGVDRLDYSKGIPERLRAFKSFLEAFPEWRRKVSMVQISVPSREALPDYADQRKIVEGLVGNINGEFGEADWVPVRYLYRSYAHSQLARLYRAASVGLVTPLRDGMNLVAKEYVASQDADNPGVLLLSKFAGAAEQLSQAVLTNPFHARGVARDLDVCLRMPLEERQARHQALLRTVTCETAEQWAGRFIDALEGDRRSLVLKSIDDGDGASRHGASAHVTTTPGASRPGDAAA